MNQLKLLVLCAGALSLFGCPPTVRPCGPATCATGCCDANGLCQSGGSVTGCGARGEECRTCSTNQTCTSGLCTTPNAMGGGSATGGGVGGGSVVGGGSGGGSVGGGAAGGMTLQCASGLTLCGTSCSNTRTDFSNCGMCGRACSAGQYCDNNACQNLPTTCTATSCPASHFCNPANSRCEFGCQTNTNCGNGQVCDPMRNLCVCPAGSLSCGGSCVPVDTVTACGPSCLSCSGGPNSIPSCTGGVCDFTCAAGYHRCGNACVSNFDALTCGTRCTACTSVPNSTPTCDGNDCGFVCAAGFHQCGTDCVSNFDVATCGNSCNPCPVPANAIAQCMSVGGGQPACTFQCNPGFARCGNQCVAESITSCGASCQTCTPPVGATNPQCVAGQCQYTCATGFHQCGSTCVSNSAVQTCGAMCTPCPAPLNGTATCNGTSCGIQCNVGFHECNGQCVTNFNVNTCGNRCTPCPDGPMGSGTTVTCDGTNCGLRCASVATPNFCNNVCVADSLTSCGPSCRTCTPPANGTAVCSVGVCDFTCQSGFHRCGMQCVADSSVDSCGTSCAACPAGPPNTITTCARPGPTSQFACGWECGAGTNRCPANGNQCVPTDYTLACGPTCAVCSSSVALERGVCGTNGICSTGCITSCNGTCVNAQTNAAHCGACNTACSGNDRCSQGECRAFCASGVGLASMLPSVAMTTSTFPFVIVDVNGDGRADMVTAQSSTLFVRLGLANATMTGPSGTFSTSPLSYFLGFAPLQIIAGDLTGDGRPEIVTLGSSTSVDVLRNDGAGGFTRSSVSAGLSSVGLSLVPTSATIGEFTGAGPADLLFSFNTTSGTQSAGLFAGTGLTGNPVSTGVSAGLGIGTVSNVRVASITADSNADIVATAASNAIYVYPGTGNGTAPFSSSLAVLAQLPSGETFTTGAAGSAFMMDVGDVTADGIPDVVVPVVSGTTTGVRVFPLTAAPAFGTSTFLATPSAARMIAIADVNGDSRRDLVVASTDVRVFLSQVGGTFSAAQVLGIGFGVTFFNSLSVVDVTGDARPEILTPSGLSIVTAVNNGTGGFAALQGFSVPNATRIEAGDLNGDGFSDAVAIGPLPNVFSGPDARLADAMVTTYGTVRGRLEVLVGGVWGPVCSPSFPTNNAMAAACRSVGLSFWYDQYYASASSLPPVMRSPVCASSLATSLLACTYQTPDVTCTGSNQLGIECETSATVTQDTTSQVLYGSATGTFTAGALLTTRGERTVIGNLNGDTAQDLVVSALGSVDGGMGPVLEVRFGATNNTLSPPTTLPLRAQPTVLLIAEVSNDTAQDLIVGSAVGVDVYRNLGFGTFAPPVTVTTTGVSSIAIGDFNLDGRRDLVTANTAFNTLQPWLNVALPGSVGFLVGTSIFPTTAGTNFSVLAGDVASAIGAGPDGKPDLIFGRSVFVGNGAGGFTLRSSSQPILPPRQVLADLDNDGALDLVSAGSASSIVSVLGGSATSTTGFVTVASGYSPGTFVEDVALARTNADSTRDLLVLQGTSGARSVVAAPGVCR
ncbi:MAG: FG-GAP-like repeat-containing protein [Myxococcales bacterium]|nr:FG-GAP-like repeat-containing protein [Myxococcales bacterium]